MMNLRQAIEAADDECFVLEPAYFDEAAIDLVRNEQGHLCVRYDSQRIIELLVEHEGMTYEDALEWFSFNIESAYLGDGTPMYLNLDGPEDGEDDE